MTIKIKKIENKLHAYSPYHPDLPVAAKKLGGKWNREAWIFDARDESRVRELYKSIYGTDGTAAMGDLTVKCTLTDDIHGYKEGIFLFGRCIARATGRDSGARLGDGVVVLSGGFGSGGSVKNWKTVGRAGTVFEIRDLPRAIVAADGCDDDPIVKYEIIEQDINKDALEAEKQDLLNRIAEIDAILNNN